MTATEMIELVQQRTKVADQIKILRELKSAYNWAVLRVYSTAGGPDLVMEYGDELTTLAATTRDFDLAGNVTAGVLFGIKQLWVKLPGDSRFTPMVERDAASTEFTDLDTATVADPDTAVGHPVLYAVLNFDQLRFAPALPASSVIRADYWKLGPAPDPSSNPEADAGSDLTSLFHYAICSKATAQLFTNLDDTREGTWENRSRDELTGAIFACSKRKQGPPRVVPFRPRVRRVN